jgi:hypothetical protein
VSASHGDVPDVPDREIVTRELDRGRHGASLVPPGSGSQRWRACSRTGGRRVRAPAMGAPRPLGSN